MRDSSTVEHEIQYLKVVGSNPSPAPIKETMYLNATNLLNVPPSEFYTVDFFFDFETRSRKDLTEVGSVNYAMESSTEATLLTWAFGRTGQIREWRKGQPIPEDLLHVARNPDRYHFIAFNIMFDLMIWNYVFSKLIPGLIHPKLQNISDCMAHTAHFRCGASLDAAAKILNLSYSKHKNGRTLMLKQTRIDKKTGLFIELNHEEMEEFALYGRTDTRLLRDVYYLTPPLPSSERFAWEWTFKRNLRGIRIDTAAVDELGAIVDEAAPLYAAEFNKLTGLTNINSAQQCLAYFKHYYPEIENMQADTIRDMLASDKWVPPNVRRALELKDMASASSIAKLKAANRLKFGERIFGFLAYAHAQTKRWAGRGIQVQNFPRVEDKPTDPIDFNLDIYNLVDFIKWKRPYLKDPIGFVKNLLRRIFIPDEGKYFYCGDWSKIEPTVLFWLTGLGDIPKKWYEEMAAAIFSKNVGDVAEEGEERQLGKSAALGCGYSMGWEKFKKDTYKKSGLRITDELSKLAVTTYRKKYKPIPALWKDLEMGFRLAIKGQATTLCNGKLVISPMHLPHKGVQIRLPSGDYLFYHRASIRPPQQVQSEDENGNKLFYTDGKPIMEWERESIQYMSDEKGTPRMKKLYGGLLCEHVTSATARAIIVPAIYNLEEADFEVTNLVHDEIWGQGNHGRDEEFKRIMCINPSWCQDMKIGASMKNGVRYLK